MKILYSKDYIFKLTRKLQVLDLITLKEVYVNKKDKISTICLLNNDLLWGTISGKLEILDTKGFTKKPVHEHTCQVTSVFSLDNYVYAGYNDGVIHKFIVNDNTLKIFKSYKHSLPIENIISNGEDLLVSDMTNKVVNYPSLVSYDIVEPIFNYKNYIFLSEKKTLFCKTRHALNSYLQTESTIKNYKFSENGGLVVILLYDRILVYDFNNKDIVNEILNSFVDFVFDESRNRIIGFYEKGHVIIEEIVDEEYDEMENVCFEENKIFEKRKMIYETEEYDVDIEDEKYYEDEYYVSELYESEEYYGGSIKERTDKKKKKSNKEEKIEKHGKDFYNTNRNTVISKDSLVSRHTRRILDDEDEASPEIETSVFPIRNDDISIFNYTDQSYLLSVKGISYRTIEVKSHDKREETIEIKDYDECVMGVCYKQSVLLSNLREVFLYNRNLIWKKEISEKYKCVLAISKKYVIISNNITRVYEHSGREIFNFHIRDISDILIDNDKIYVFSDKLTIISLFTDTNEYSLPGRVVWSCVCNGRIYYKIQESVYLFVKGLSCRIFENVKYPLTVIGNRLIELNANMKLLPSPCINYKDIPFIRDTCLISDKREASLDELSMEDDIFKDEC